MKLNEIREVFLNYFQTENHKIVASSPLIPANDQTLLFTNAGMIQFKDVFLGKEQRSYSRAATVQRCMRVSGKHNDLEQVGFTARHHTFFEMLGNFSFGDYFKKEAINYAWNFLTNVLNIPKEKLWITVYKDDDEATDIWLKEIGVDPSRFSRCGEKDNFWTMGDTGPCGPCTEIFYDHGSDIAGVTPGHEGEEGNRYVEIWNLVFMQYNRDASGNLTPLPKPSVDTGMGLERLAAVIQGVHSNYDIDLFQHLIKATATLADYKDLSNPSLKVIADHIRASAFLIVDGIVPSNESRGYVLRRIIRRAILHGNKLGFEEPFFYKLLRPLVEVMGEAYPKLEAMHTIIENVLFQEEEQFAKTLNHGLKILEQYIEKSKGKIILGDVAFKLSDTYGFPIDLTAVIAGEKGFTVDEAGFEREREKQRKKSKEASKFKETETDSLDLDCITEFTGYNSLKEKAAIVALFHNNQSVQSLNNGQEGCVVLDRTPFYAESGGQAGDVGEILLSNDVFHVTDTKKSKQAFLHCGILESGTIKINDTITAQVDSEKRQAAALNHSATHLLHGALRHVLGEHVEQKGSFVDANRLRFDFSHFKAVSARELFQAEKIVNEQIRENHPIDIQIMPLEEAKAKGAIALFGEKYGENPRVIAMGDFSTELCGGTHAKRTGDIGLFKIISETGTAAGIRRIEAATGFCALNFTCRQQDTLQEIYDLLKTDKHTCVEKLKQLIRHQHYLEQQINKTKVLMVKNIRDDLLKKAKTIDDLTIITAQVADLDTKKTHDLVDQLKNKLHKGVIILAAIDAHKKISLFAGVTKNCTDTFHAGELVQIVAKEIDGKGGGRPDMAQGGGTNFKKLSHALSLIEPWIREKQKN